MNSLLGFLLVAVIIAFFCLSLIFSFRNNHAHIDKSKKSRPLSHPHRYKRFAKTTNSSFTCPEDNSAKFSDSPTLECMDLFLRSNDTEKFFERFIHSRKYTHQSKESISEHSKYAKLIDNYPALSFSINLPSFDCFLNSSRWHYFQQIESVFRKLQNDAYGFIQIQQIPLDKITLIVDSMYLNFLQLRSISQKAGPSAFPLSFEKDKCHFISNCHVLVRYFQDKNYTVSFHFSKLNKETTELSPEIESFEPEFLSLLANIVNYDSIENAILEDTSHPNSIHKAEMSNYDTNYENILKKISTLLLEKIPNITKNLAYEILMDDFSSIHDDFIIDDNTLQKDKGSCITPSYFEIANQLEQKQVEFFTFVMQQLDISEITSKKSITESQYVGVTIAVNEANITYLMTTESEYNDVKYLNHDLLAQWKASEEVAEKYSKDKNALIDYKKKSVLLTAFGEYFELVHKMSTELKNSSQQSTKMDQIPSSTVEIKHSSNHDIKANSKLQDNSEVGSISNEKYKKMAYIIIPIGISISTIGLFLLYLKYKRRGIARDDLSFRALVETQFE